MGYLSIDLLKADEVPERSQTLLDHMYVTAPDNIRKHHVPQSGMSDHYPVCLVHKVSGQRNGHHTTIKYRSYKTFDPIKFNDDLDKVPWSILDTLDDVNDALYRLLCLLQNVRDEHIPWCEKQVKRQLQPKWMSEDILNAIGTRDHENYKIWRS